MGKGSYEIKNNKISIYYLTADDAFNYYAKILIQTEYEILNDSTLILDASPYQIEFYKPHNVSKENLENMKIKGIPFFKRIFH